MRQLLLMSALLLCTATSKAQGYVDQEKTEPLSYSQEGPIDNVQKVKWTVFNYEKVNKTGPWTRLTNELDSLPGEEQGLRREIVQLANHVSGDKMRKGRKLVVPASFPLDYRAYSPYPFHYAAAANIPKLFIIDKYTQTFGAYENGNLVHWGLVCAGREDNLTPNGKYHFTWKTEYRESNAAPPGEVWKMYWVFNFIPSIGIHVHQYSLPLANPSSHGCVRVSLGDAKWNYNWADGSADGGKGTSVWVINHNPVGKSAHWDIGADGEVHSLVRLPDQGEDADQNFANR